MNLRSVRNEAVKGKIIKKQFATLLNTNFSTVYFDQISFFPFKLLDT